MKKRKNVKEEGYWPIALDVGYSSVKGFSPNLVYCFPSFAKLAGDEESALDGANMYDIRYRNEEGEVWNVGYLAQDTLEIDDTNDSATALYGRNRYYSQMFLVITRVGLAMGLSSNEYGEKQNWEKIIVQAGLPPKYKNRDSKFIKEVTSGRHVFDLKIGKGDWVHYDFTIGPDNVLVMAQPMGALWSAACDNDGKFIKEALRYFNSKVLIIDPGFGTVDLFLVVNRTIQGSETYNDLGMKRIFQEVIKEIEKTYGEDISIVKMQEVLRENGKIRVMDAKLMQSRYEDITPVLEEANKKICVEAMERSKQAYNYFRDIDFLIIGGGTGSAWMDYIKEHLYGMETLTIVEAIQNDELQNFFANVRGYYMFLLASIRASKKKTSKKEIE